MIRLAALDIAGTTIDDAGAVYEALERSVIETGATVRATDLQEWMGTEKPAALRALINLGGGVARDEVVDAAYRRFVELLGSAYRARPPVALPGAAEAIATLRSAGIKVALTTGFSTDVACHVLATVGWRIGEHIDALVCADEVAAGRPAPYMIHRAMERAGVDDVRDVLVAGDTLVDLRAGKASGAAITIGVCSGKLDRVALMVEAHDAIVDSVADIPGLVGVGTLART